MAFGEDKGVKILKQILELDPIEFLGICKILGVKIYDTSKLSVECAPAMENDHEPMPPRDFSDIWGDVCDAVDGLNRVQKRTLQKLIKAATKKEN